MGAFSVGPCGQGAAVGRDRLTDSRFGGNPQFRIREPDPKREARDPGDVSWVGERCISEYQEPVSVRRKSHDCREQL
jgi:hypothetical protein